MENRRAFLKRAFPLLALLAVAVVAAGPSAGGITRPFVRVQVPLDQRVSDLVHGRLVENLTCVQACRTRTTLYIRARLARRLGFKHVNGKPVAVGSKSVTLSAGRKAKIRVPLDASSKKLMSKANLGIQLIGSVVAHAEATSRRGAANWITSLSP